MLRRRQLEALGDLRLLSLPHQQWATDAAQPVAGWATVAAAEGGSALDGDGAARRLAGLKAVLEVAAAQQLEASDARRRRRRRQRRGADSAEDEQAQPQPAPVDDEPAAAVPQPQGAAATAFESLGLDGPLVGPPEGEVSVNEASGMNGGAPMSWPEFISSKKGKGLSMKEIGQQYREYKVYFE